MVVVEEVGALGHVEGAKCAKSPGQEVRLLDTGVTDTRERDGGTGRGGETSGRSRVRERGEEGQWRESV